MVFHLTNVWCLLTKSTTLEILWALKHNKVIKRIKNETCVSFGPKTSDWALNLFCWCIWQTSGVCWSKVPHLWYFRRQNTKRRLKRSKTKFVFLLGLKRAIGIKTFFGVAFDKLLLFVYQKCTTLEILWALKHKKEIKKIKNQTCVSLRPETSNLAYKLFWWCIWQTFGVCWPKVPHLRYFRR